MGQLQTSQIELEALCARLAPVFLEYLRTHGTAVDRIEIAATLDGITSLPARYSLGGVEKNVLAPLSLLTKGVDEAIDSCLGAEAAANTAANNANSAAARAEAATEGLDEVRTEAVLAAESANAASAAANAKLSEFDTLGNELTAAEHERVVAENERKAHETSRISAEEARAAAEAERVSNENTRKSNEKSRVSAENSRKSAEASRNSQVRTAVDSANAAAKNANDAAAALQGAQWYVPTHVEVKFPIEIYDEGGNLQWQEGFISTIDHRHRDAVFSPRIKVFPEGARQNVIFKEESYTEDPLPPVVADPYIGQFHDENGIGYVSPTFWRRRPGFGYVYIIPVDNPGATSAIDYQIFPAAMRLTGGGAWRGNGKGRLRLVKNRYKRLGFRRR